MSKFTIKTKEDGSLTLNGQTVSIYPLREAAYPELAGAAEQDLGRFYSWLDEAEVTRAMECFRAIFGTKCGFTIHVVPFE